MIHASSVRTALLLALCAAVSTAVPAQAELLERQRIPGPWHPANPDNNPGIDRIDLSGDTMVVGASRMALGQGAGALASVGAAYVYVRPAPGQPFVQQAELRPGDPAANQFFGLNVAIDGDRIAVGAIGAVYLFERSGSTWTQTGRIARSPLARGMALDGERLAVGDWTVAVGGRANAGRVELYRVQAGGWVREAEVFDPSPDAEDGFGREVSLSGPRLLCYSANHSGGLSDPVAHVFARDAAGRWRHEAALQPDWQTGVFEHVFRLSSIAIDGDTVLIQGGPRAAILERGANGWRQVQVIDKRVWGFDANDYYQDLEGDAFVVSSARRVYDGPGFVSLVFRRVGGFWVKQATLTQTDGYGLALPQIDGDTVVATRSDVASPCSGGASPTCGKDAVYVYELQRLPETYGIGCPGARIPAFAVDAVPDLGVLGDPRRGGRLDFSIQNAAPGSLGFVVFGLNKSFVPLGGGCWLQLAPLPEALGPLPLSGGAAGPAASGAVNFSLPVPIGAPSRFVVQVLVIDAASPNGMFTVSGAAEVNLR
jgi:hypothetical protein